MLLCSLYDKKKKWLLWQIVRKFYLILLILFNVTNVHNNVFLIRLVHICNLCAILLNWYIVNLPQSIVLANIKIPGPMEM